MGKTTIDHSIRVKLKLNCLEYCVMDFYVNSQRHPEPKEYMNYLGITHAQVCDCINSLIKKQLLLGGQILPKWSNEFKKENPIEEKIEGFRISVQQFKIEYTDKMIKDFFDYWSELNKSKTRMRWELEKTWDISKRLARWYNNNNKGNKGEPVKDNTTYTIK